MFLLGNYRYWITRGTDKYWRRTGGTERTSFGSNMDIHSLLINGKYVSKYSKGGIEPIDKQRTREKAGSDIDYRMLAKLC
jgi:hypothetical protein